MGGLSLWHWLVVIIVVLLLFGRGKISELMGDVGKGLKSFKQGMAEEDKPARPADPRQLQDRPIDITPQSPPPAEPETPPPPPPTASPDEPPRS